ncbi:hypothetical protein PRIO_4561 [Paenibacillus riograndensis SBR5]|uniref:Uncharacterized protein n=1 Tax=Paenibacillus riograndensis SBR5 TaxID=1073571 RepID=A0A0E3WIF8_9BACL|nr:hypothetical protein PRIO_4561 [Paenibacillus riograndensis SBR5]
MHKSLPRMNTDRNSLLPEIHWRRAIYFCGRGVYD